MSPSKLSHFLALTVCVSMIAHPLMANPWDRQRYSQPNNNYDPEKHSRSRVDPLKSREMIKEHKGKVSAVRKLLFKEGGLPTKAMLTTDKIGANGSQAVNVQAQFGDFTDQLKPQILSKLNLTGAPQESTLVTIKATVTGDNSIQITQAKINASRPGTQSDFRPSVPLQANNPRLQTPNRQTSQRPNRNLKTVKNNQNNPSVFKQFKNSPQAQQQSKNPQMVRAMAPSAQTQPLRLQQSVRSLATKAQPELMIVARGLAKTMGGNPNQVRLKAIEIKGTDDLKAGAVIPLKNGKEVTVTRVQETTPGTFEVQFQARVNDLPQPMQQRVQPKIKGKGIEANQPVDVVMNIKPDNTMAVKSVKPIQVFALNTTPVQNLAQQPKSNAPVSPNNASSTPSNTLQATNEAPKVLDGTLGPQSLGQAILQSPEAKSLQQVTSVLVSEFIPVQNLMQISKSEKTDTLVATIPIQDNANMSVYKVEENLKTGEVTYRAEAQFGDLSSPVRKEILDVLTAYGGGSLVDKRTPVEIDVTRTTDDSITLISIKIKDTDAREPGQQETVLLWGQPKDVANENRTKKIPLISQLKNTSPLTLTKSPREGPKQGLLPTLSRAVQSAFNLKPDEFAAVFAPNFVKDEVMITRPKDDLPAIHIQWRQGEGNGSYQFFAEGTALEFSDKIREQVYQKLRDELTKGEKWARDALTGNKKLTVLLEAVLNPDTQQVDVQVKDVGISLEAAAQELAMALGLSEGDYNLLIDDANGLITVQPGKIAKLRNLKLVSSNAPIHILVKRKNLSQKDQTSVYMSRVSLKENAQALDTVMKSPNGKGLASTILAQNPSAEHFHIQINAKSASGGDIIVVGKKKKKASKGRKSLEKMFQQ